MDRCGPVSRISSLNPPTTRSPFLTRCSEGNPLRRLLLRSKAEVVGCHGTSPVASHSGLHDFSRDGTKQRTPDWQAMGGRVEVSFRRRRMTASIAASSGSKARLFERMDARVRAGPLGARSTVESSQPDVGSTVMPAANGFGYFCRNTNSPRRWTARKKTRMSCTDSGRARISLCQVLTHLLRMHHPAWHRMQLVAE